MGQSTGILLLFHISNNMEGRAHLQLMQQLGRNGDTYPTHILPNSLTEGFFCAWILGRVFWMNKSIFH